MRVALDPYDRATAYADLRDDEQLTSELRCHAIKRASGLGAAQVEFWRPPYGNDSTDRMAGFIELARVPHEPAAPSREARTEQQPIRGQL